MGNDLVPDPTGEWVRFEGVVNFGTVRELALKITYIQEFGEWDEDAALLRLRMIPSFHVSVHRTSQIIDNHYRQDEPRKG